MSRTLLALFAILFVMTLTAAASAFDRKGRLIESSTNLVCRNEAGQLAIGGDTLKIKETFDGSLLSISIDGVPHYLVYPTD